MSELITSVTSYLPSLPLSFTGPSEPIQELKHSLTELSEQIDAFYSENFLNRIFKVQDQIKTVTECPTKINFKNYSWNPFQPWEAYLDPLITLRETIETYVQTPSSQSRDLLKKPLKEALKLIEGEVKKQTSLLPFQKNPLPQGQTLSPFSKLINTIEVVDHFSKDKENRLWINLRVRNNLKEIEDTYFELKKIEGFTKNDRITGEIDIHAVISKMLRSFEKNRTYEEALKVTSNKYLSSNHDFRLLERLSQRETLSFSEISAALEAIELILQKNQFEQVITRFSIEKNFKNIYQTISFLKTINEHSNALKIDSFSYRCCEVIAINLDWIEQLHLEDLNTTEKASIHEIQNLIQEKQHRLNHQEWDTVLMKFEKIFNSGFFLNQVGLLNSESSPAPQVTHLTSLLKVKDLETSTIKFEKNCTEIQKEANVLAHTLSMRLIFNFFADRYRIEPETREALFKTISNKIELHPYDGSQEQLENRKKREKIFKEELNKIISQHSYFNFKILNWIVSKCVKYVIGNLSDFFVKNAQTSILQFSELSLKDRIHLIRSANHVIGSLRLPSETSEEGEANTQEMQLCEALEKKKIQERLTEKVVNKALDTFIIPALFFNRSSIFNNKVIHFFLKKGIKQFVQPEEYLNNQLKEVREIHLKKFAPYLDTFLLKELEKFEETLKEVKKEKPINDVSPEERKAVSKFVENFLGLVRERKDSSLLKKVLEYGLDIVTIKTTLEDSIFLANRELNPVRKEEISECLLDGLKNINTLFHPSEEVIPDVHPHILQEQHAQTEKNLHEKIGQILHTIIEKKTTSFTESKQSDEDILSEYANWLRQKLYSQNHGIEKTSCYIDQIDKLSKELVSSAKNSNEKEALMKEIKRVHHDFLAELRDELNLLDEIKKADPSKINVEINELYQITSILMKPLKKIHKHFLKDDYQTLSRRILSFKEEIEGFKDYLNQIQLRHKRDVGFSFVNRLKECAVRHVMDPLVHPIAHGHLMDFAEEIIRLYKLPSTITAIIERGVLPGYLNMI